MAKIVITKEELQHDEVLETTDKFLHWLKQNSTAILTVILVAFAVYATVLFVQGRRTKLLMEGNVLLAEAEQDYGEGLTTHAWASPERVKAMQEVSDKADKIIADYSGTPVARQALLLKGNAWYNAGDQMAESIESGAKNTQKAIEAFEQYVAESDEGTFEAAAGSLALGYAYENAFFLNRAQAAVINDAMRQYGAVEANPKAGFLADEAKLARARILAFNGKTDEAKKLYYEVLEARYEPIIAPADMLTDQTASAMHFIRQQREQFTLANTARTALRTLGETDVNEKYPLVKQPDAEEDEEAAAN